MLYLEWNVRVICYLTNTYGKCLWPGVTGDGKWGEVLLGFDWRGSWSGRKGRQGSKAGCDQ
jgi:hypothetical protein